MEAQRGKVTCPCHKARKQQDRNLSHPAISLWRRAIQCPRGQPSPPFPDIASLLLCEAPPHPCPSLPQICGTRSQQAQERNARPRETVILANEQMIMQMPSQELSPTSKSTALLTGYKHTNTQGIQCIDSWARLPLPIISSSSVFESVVPRLAMSKDTRTNGQLPCKSIKKA